MHEGMAVSVSTKAVLLAAALVASACDGAPDEGGRGPRNADEVTQRRVNVARCDSAIPGNADGRWRERSTAVGNAGFYGPGRDFRSAQRSGDGGDLITKMPVIIEGGSGMTLWIPRQERDRVALLFGKIPATEPYEIGDGYTQVRFVPCTDRERTGFVGGLALRDRRPVALKVRLEGTDRIHTVTLGGLPPAER
jgi:hypothetical protein